MIADEKGNAKSASVTILGIRGVPAAHGGFETFAERLSLWLRDCGWSVTVYCQGSETGHVHDDDWQGIRRIHIPVRTGGAFGTIEFDAKATIHAARRSSLFLTLGYNTGFLNILIRLLGKANYINMDGLEWKRDKYSRAARAYLWINEKLAALCGTGLIADHPAIKTYLSGRADEHKITMIPYGADPVTTADAGLLTALGLEPEHYLTLIARPVPENSILEIVQAFSLQRRTVKLVILGQYSRSDPFQAKVLDAAGPDVIFPGAIYDKDMLGALRFHSLAYLHGHRVGGTNPSLVEALAAGNPVIAHDNVFNRWVAGDAGVYFDDVASCARLLEQVIADAPRRAVMSMAARTRWQHYFTWPMILKDYATLLAAGLPRTTRTSPVSSDSGATGSPVSAVAMERG